MPASDPPERDRQRGVASQSRGTVLVVDDDLGLCDAVRDVLEERGFAVALAHSGDEALAMLAEGPLPNLVLLDLIMPVMTGSQVLARLRKEPELACVPVIVMSADPSSAPQSHPVLQKPLVPERLLELVELLRT